MNHDVVPLTMRLTISSGQVNNTDAEGRLTLADAMLYCQQQGVSQVVDIATLTGACMVALGKDITGRRRR